MQRRINPREQRRMMERMGMNMDAVPDVTQVIIKTSSKDIVINEPEVAILNVQGQKIYQIIGGKVTETAPSASHPTASAPAATATAAKSAVSEEDAQLVADQTGKSLAEAKRALEESGGDLAKAILLLQ